MIDDGIDRDSAEIHAVVTWVDGDDPAHAAKRQRYVAGHGSSASGLSATRFRSCGEILFCLGSILKFAPFVTRIHIVTDRQTPPVFDELESAFPGSAAKMRLVDHSEIFSAHEELLPTFSSRSIESMIFRINGLSRRFIYFNDDFFIARPVSPHQFFRNGRPILRGQWRSTYDLAARRLYRRIARQLFSVAEDRHRVGFKSGQWKGFQAAGIRGRYFWHDHTPHPVDRARMDAAFREMPDRLLANAAHRLRSDEQFNVMAYADALEILSGNQNFEPTRLVYMQPANRSAPVRYLERKFRQIAETGALFGCIQSLDMAAPAARAFAIARLETLIFE
jgi:hypothetical protein